jgi:hypothetical protein
MQFAETTLQTSVVRDSANTSVRINEPPVDVGKVEASPKKSPSDVTRTVSDRQFFKVKIVTLETSGEDVKLHS